MTTTLSARTMGNIREIRVQPGDSVKAGQVVAVVDARDIEASLRQAEGAQREAQSARPEADNGVAAAQAQLDLAESTFRRMKSLYDEKSITPQEFDEAQARVRMARANHQMALAKRQQLTEKIAQAGEGVAQAKLQTGYASIVAPFAGVVIERKAEPGMLASPGTPIVVLEQAGNYRLEAAVEESKLGRMRVGMAVQVHVDAFDEEINGRVGEIVPALDAGSHSVTVKIDLPYRAGLHSGLFGRANFTFGKRTALTVPATAVTAEGQVQRVFVAQGGIVRARMVRTGVTAAGRSEILSGLSAGEWIVAKPSDLRDGDRVEVRQ